MYTRVPVCEVCFFFPLGLGHGVINHNLILFSFQYDREFDSDESGSEEIDLNSLHHEQFEETFERVPSRLV